MECDENKKKPFVPPCMREPIVVGLPCDSGWGNISADGCTACTDKPENCTYNEEGRVK